MFIADGGEASRSSTVHMNSAWTAEKMGFVSPAYSRDTRGTGVSGHGIMGGIGYTSSSHNTLQPATMAQQRDSSLRVLHAGRAQKAMGATADSITSSKRANAGRLTQADIYKMEDNAKQQQAAYLDWKKIKDAEHAKKKERETRLQRQDMQRYVQREMRVRDEGSDRFKEWSIRKGLQSEVQAMERALIIKMTRGMGKRRTPPNPVSKKLESGFDLRTEPTQLPTRKGFDATLPYLFAPAQTKTASARGTLAELLAQTRLARAQQEEAATTLAAADDAQYAEEYDEGEYYEDGKDAEAGFRVNEWGEVEVDEEHATSSQRYASLLPAIHSRPGSTIENLGVSSRYNSRVGSGNSLRPMSGTAPPLQGDANFPSYLVDPVGEDDEYGSQGGEYVGDDPEYSGAVQQYSSQDGGQDNGADSAYAGQYNGADPAYVGTEEEYDMQRFFSEKEVVGSRPVSAALPAIDEEKEVEEEEVVPSEH